MENVSKKQKPLEQPTPYNPAKDPEAPPKPGPKLKPLEPKPNPGKPLNS